MARYSRDDVDRWELESDDRLLTPRRVGDLSLAGNLGGQRKVRQCQLKVSLDALPIPGRQPAADRFDPPIVSLDRSPVCLNDGLVSHPLTLNPVLSRGLGAVVPAARTIELDTRLGDSTLVTGTSAEQPAQPSRLDGGEFLPCGLASGSRMGTQVERRRLIVPQETREIEARGPVEASLEDRCQPLQDLAGGLIEVFGLSLASRDRGLASLTLGRLLGSEPRSLDALLLAKLLAGPLLLVIAPLRHVDPP
jgi:hypothetical protein